MLGPSGCDRSGTAEHQPPPVSKARTEGRVQIGRTSKGLAAARRGFRTTTQCLAPAPSNSNVACSTHPCFGKGRAPRPRRRSLQPGGPLRVRQTVHRSSSPAASNILRLSTRWRIQTGLPAARRAGALDALTRETHAGAPGPVNSKGLLITPQSAKPCFPGTRLVVMDGPPAPQ